MLYSYTGSLFDYAVEVIFNIDTFCEWYKDF